METSASVAVIVPSPNSTARRALRWRRSPWLMTWLGLHPSATVGTTLRGKLQAYNVIDMTPNVKDVTIHNDNVTMEGVSVSSAA